MATIPGTFGPDSLTGTTSDDLFFPQTGDDTIFAGAGNDTIWAALGNNTIDLGTGADVAHLSDGNHFVSAASDVGPAALGDTIITGSGNDTIEAGGGDNYINAGNGNNQVYWVEGVGGAILAGSGTDTLDLSRSSAGHEIYSAAGGIAGSTVYFAGFEKIVGTNFNDTVWGSLATVDGGAGNDEIHGSDTASNLLGGVGNDIVIGGAGNDTIDGGTGSNYLAGGAGSNVFMVGLGDDTVAADGAENTLDLSLAAGGADIWGHGSITGSGFSVAYNPAIVGRYVGSSSADTFHNFYRGTLEGGAGIDTLDNSQSTTALTIDLSQPVSPALDLNLVSIEGAKTGTGNDTIIGNDDGNQLDAGAGNDDISGGAGNDTIVGGSGGDVLTGGDGANTFVFAGEFGEDLILDFKVGVDKLEFDGITAAQVTFTADGEVAFGDNRITILSDGDLSISDFIFS
ncbi:calcium-binding protein [Belnapia arida]|nr:calcium-binding protein [Belnapia arida]